MAKTRSGEFRVLFRQFLIKILDILTVVYQNALALAYRADFWVFRISGIFICH